MNTPTINTPTINTPTLGAYLRLMRLDKPIGILLLLWPTLWGLWFAAGGLPPWRIALVFVLGTVLMRSAGCVINDWADRDFDGEVKRTALRPLVTGEVSPRAALLLAAGLTLVAGGLVLWLNPLSMALAIPAAILAGTYPFFKRFFAIPQAYLGVAFGFGIPMAFAAVQGRVPMLAWVLLAANVLWCIAYDTEYAMVDRDDDIRLGIRTSALTFGRFDVLAVMLCYAGSLILLALAAQQAHFSGGFGLGLAVAAGVAAYHFTLIRTRTRAGCFKAFLHNTWFGAAVFLGTMLGTAWV